MHELAIASSVLEAARAETRLRPGMRLTKIAVRVGDLSGLDPEALSFCFEAVVKETDFETVVLEIERVSQRRRCSRCKHEFVVTGYDTACPACHDPLTVLFGGDELELAYLEMEEP